MSEPPSGEQIELAADGRHAVVVEVGAGLRTYSVDGRDVLDGYAADAMCTSGRGQVLIPWPNRIAGGAYAFDGRRLQLALTEPEAGNAIHGLVRWAPWRVRERDEARCVLEHVLHPQPGYPFTLALSLEYSLGSGGLTVRTTATNVGREACPFGAGQHPYLTLGTPTVDPLVLTLPGREPYTIGETQLDTPYGDLERDADGVARVELRAPDGTQATVWFDAAYRYVQLFTGDPLPDVARRSIAVEPMTCPPNAFRTGESLLRLEPGDSFEGAWGIS